MRSSQAVHSVIMEAGIVPEMLDLKLHNEYPTVSTSKDGFEIKRVVDTCRIK